MMFIWEMAQLSEIQPTTARSGVHSEQPLEQVQSNISIKQLKQQIAPVEPKISVVIPVFMEEKILESTLSLYTPELRRKYDLEIIVSDGGSTDSTLEIARRHADIVVEHADKSRRQTISEGRNMGALYASGSTIVFINGDTAPQDLDNFFAFVADWNAGKTRHSSAGALACFVNVDKKEKIFKDKLFYGFHNAYVRSLNAIGMGMGRGECQIVRTATFKAVGGYNAKVAAGEDFDLYRRIGKIAKIRFATEITVLESPRRFRKYGYLRILLSWTLNSLAVMFFGRSYSEQWEAVR
jgi:glycosyltransferase involved in cell wall biosynthesis